jgi:uncharacterized Zn finger protein
VVTKATAGKGEKRMTLGSPRCPACGSLFVVPPSLWDRRPLWRCEECGAVWLATTWPPAEEGQPARARGKEVSRKRAGRLPPEFS